MEWLKDKLVDMFIDTFSEKGSNRCIACDNRLKDFTNGQVWLNFCSEDCLIKSVLVCLKKERKQQGNVKICLKPGCDKMRFRDPETNESKDYCGNTHVREHREELLKEFIQQQRNSTSPGMVFNMPYQLSYPIHQATFYEYRRSDQGPILFYNRDEPYYEFTNFAQFRIVIDGTTYPTSEHYFQSQKLVGTPYCKYIATLERPRQAFEFPRQPHVANWVRKDWQNVKDDVMYKALYHKFTQHSYLRQLLLSTQDRRLVEHSPYDSYWGDGGDGKGLNKLGELLMKLRHALRGHPDSPMGTGYSHVDSTPTQLEAKKKQQVEHKQLTSDKQIQLDDSGLDEPEVGSEKKTVSSVDELLCIGETDSLPKPIAPNSFNNVDPQNSPYTGQLISQSDTQYSVKREDKLNEISKYEQRDNIRELELQVKEKETEIQPQSNSEKQMFCSTNEIPVKVEPMEIENDSPHSDEMMEQN